MQENDKATILRYIGNAQAVCGLLAGIIIILSDWGWWDYAWWGIAIAIVGCVSCAMFHGFAELIDLLQKSTYNQSLILRQLELSKGKTGEVSTSVLEDIERNLPRM